MAPPGPREYLVESIAPKNHTVTSRIDYRESLSLRRPTRLASSTPSSAGRRRHNSALTARAVRTYSPRWSQFSWLRYAGGGPNSGSRPRRGTRPRAGDEAQQRPQPPPEPFCRGDGVRPGTGARLRLRKPPKRFSEATPEFGGRGYRLRPRRGIGGFFPRVGPEQVHGIELDPYATELVTGTLWIGYIK